MGFLDSLKSIFAGGPSGDQSSYWLYVRCRRCGEAIKTRIDLNNDLSLNDEGGFVVNKTLIGRKFCFERVEVSLTFDANRRLLDRHISRGDFLTAAEYEAAAAETGKSL
ncbi:MAG: hypothetical protein AB1801_15080 [Chloroflexota bacterium]